MSEWYNMHPVICPLPKGFLDNDTSHKESREWMIKATLEIEKLRAENDELNRKYSTANGVNKTIYRNWRELLSDYNNLKKQNKELSKFK